MASARATPGAASAAAAWPSPRAWLAAPGPARWTSVTPSGMTGSTPPISSVTRFGALSCQATYHVPNLSLRLPKRRSQGCQCPSPFANHGVARPAPASFNIATAARKHWKTSTASSVFTTMQGHAAAQLVLSDLAFDFGSTRMQRD